MKPDMVMDKTEVSSVTGICSPAPKIPVSVEQVNTIPSDDCWFLRTRVANFYMEWLMDCGANPNLLSLQMYNSIPESQRPALQPVSMQLTAANGDAIVVHGQTAIDIHLEGASFSVEVIVANIGATAGILGMKFLRETDCRITFRTGLLRCEEREWKLVGPINPMPVKCNVSMVASTRQSLASSLTSLEPSTKGVPLEVCSGTREGIESKTGLADTMAANDHEYNGAAAWSAEELKQLQQGDDAIRIVIQWIRAGKGKPCRSKISRQGPEVNDLCGIWPTLVLQDGLLYRRWEKKKYGPVLQLVAPSAIRVAIFEHAHSDHTGGHIGIKRTKRRVRAQFFWPQAKTDIDQWCRQCDNPTHVRSMPDKVVDRHTDIEDTEQLRPQLAQLQMPELHDASALEEVFGDGYPPDPPTVTVSDRQLESPRLHHCPRAVEPPDL